MAVRLLLVAATLFSTARGACVDDPEVDLCDDPVETDAGLRASGRLASGLVLAGIFGATGTRLPMGGLLLLAPLAMPLAAGASTEVGGAALSGSCGAMKAAYKAEGCCGKPDEALEHVVLVPKPQKKLFSPSNNPCVGKKPLHANATAQDLYFQNVDCMKDGVMQALEQAGANVTKGYVGSFNATGRTPILTSYYEAGLCPVNVHWHLGAEHYSAGEYDEHGKGPASAENQTRRLAGGARRGFRCNKFEQSNAKFTKPYAWQHCVGMHVGETYEVHWPHSAAGACGTPYQYQTPFYDGVFCRDGIISLNPLNTFQKIGVQSQVFTIVNDEDYYHPDLIDGMIVDGAYGEDVAKYTGSTTGTSRSNTVCSRYTPITWQVDRKCHLISASSFDKMCADMKAKADDMGGDLHAHGARELVADHLAADNLQRL